MHREAPREEHRPPRGEHEHFLFEGVEFPATKQELVDFARDLEADVRTLNLVDALPDRTYTDRNDVWRSIAEATRVMSGAPGSGFSRDNIGLQAVRRPIRHP